MVFDLTIDSVGLTLLCCLVLRSLLDAVYSAVGFILTHRMGLPITKTAYIPFGQSQTAFWLFSLSRSLINSSLSFIIRELPLASEPH